MKQTTKLSMLSAGVIYLSSSIALADTVTQLKGKAYITNTSNVKPLILYQKLKNGDQITTGENSHVRIQLTEKCQIDIPPMHFVRVKDLKSCPKAIPINRTAVTKSTASTGTKIAGVTTTKASSALPLLFLSGAALAAIIHDNRKSSPD